MAENTESPRMRNETWVIAALAAAGLACVSLVAVALVLILRQPSGANAAPITASPVINIQNGPSAPTPGIVRPSEPAKPQATRSSAQDRVQPALPGRLAPIGGVVRADQQVNDQAAKATLPSPDKKIFLRVRGEGLPPTSGRAPLPMPVRYRADAQGQVESVFASRGAANAPLPPDRPYADASSSDAQMELQLLQPRSTSALDGFRAPEGFAFFTAKLGLHNKGAQSAALDLGALEIRDADGAVYLANPELSGKLPPQLPAGEKAEASVSFLVSDQSPLAAFALRLGDGSVLIPLSRR